VDAKDQQQLRVSQLEQAIAIPHLARADAWHLYDKLVPLVASVSVANPMQSRADRQDAGQD
jgi:hypothetical protein